ncbi:hypothetical protein [Intrasporangium sp. YIM S08009]|uniref:hypothetical protein n=1 Tax=Intrasporangium zincisolvens TaxID=3080018 RepID=UPI002B05C941|nr:hypothetical protein [Intrasporangium sp. YIM S08009]
MKIATATAALALVATAALTSAGSASASGRQDTACMRAGMNTLKSLGVFPHVAAKGLPISTALAVGVTPRPGADISGVPDPIPLSLLLADHRAGSHSLFVYPWCS